MTVGVYSIAVQDRYVAIASLSLSITRHFNPYLPLTLFYADCSRYLLDKLARDYDVQLVNVGPVGDDRWLINFLKWHVDLGCLGEVSHYLYLDCDAFIVGALTRKEVLSVSRGPVNIGVHPLAGEVVTKKRAIWTLNEPAAYYVPRDKRTTYYNAGVVLCTKEGMDHLRDYLEAARYRDECNDWYGTSPYYDENYLNRYALVDHPEMVCGLPEHWDRFHSVRGPEAFHICHMVAYGGALDDPIRKLQYVRQKFGVEDPSFRNRFFPDDYFGTGWLMETPDRFMLLGILSSLKPRKMVWVGVWEGKDLEVLRRRHPETEIHAVDITQAHFRETAMEEGWIEFHCGDSREVLPELLPLVKPDTVVIDGSHDYGVVSEDITNSLRLCPDATVLGHDISYVDVERAAREASGIFPNRELHIIKTPETFKFEATYGGFFLFEPEVKDFAKL